MSETRTETDSFGPLDVPADKLYGAQSARSLINFPIGEETMPAPMIRALGIIKRSAARVNKSLGNLEPEIRRDRAGRGRSRRRQVECPFPAIGLADRLGHAVEHEHQ